MSVSTITTRTLQIDGMTGDECVKKVTGVLKGIPGVTTQSVRVGSATIVADDDGCDAACEAIDGAGFRSHADWRSGNTTGSTPQAPMADPAPKMSGQCCTSTQGMKKDSECASNAGIGPKGPLNTAGDDSM